SAAYATSNSGRAKLPRRPSGWVGQVKYDYTFIHPGSDTSKATETANVTFKRIKGRGGSTYAVKIGQITWQASGDDTYCTWTSAGSRAANRYDAVLLLDLSSRPYKALFTSPDNLDIVQT